MATLTISDMVDALLDAGKSAGVQLTTAQLLTGTGPYTLAQVHRAIRFTFRDFVRQTKCTRQIDSLTLTADTAAVSFAGISDFDPERIVGGGIRVVADSNYSSSDPAVAKGIEVVGPERLADAMLGCGTGTGVPTLLTFDTFTAGFPSSATVWRTPKATGTAKVEWSPPPIYYLAGVATAWVAGATTVGTYTFNIRDDLAEKAIRTGGVVYLQNGEIQNVPMTVPLKQAYIDHINASRGLGGLGVRSITRMSSDCLRRGY